MIGVTVYVYILSQDVSFTYKLCNYFVTVCILVHFVEKKTLEVQGVSRKSKVTSEHYFKAISAVDGASTHAVLG